jgi:hypothetical protein
MRAKAPARPWMAAPLALVAVTLGCGSGSPPPVDGGADTGDAAGNPDPAEPDAADAPSPDADPIDTAPSGQDGGSDDGGQPTGPRWVRLYTPGIAAVEHLAIDPQGTLYAASGRVVAFASANERDRTSPGVYRSRDLGASWEPVSRGLDDYGFASLHASGDLLLAGNRMLVGSRDSGRTWRSLHSLDPTSVFVGADGDLIVAASGDFSRTTAARSTDGGKSFVALTFREEAREIRALAVRGQLVLVGYRGGIQRSTDGGIAFLPVVIEPAVTLSPSIYVTRIVIHEGNLVLAVAGGKVIRSEDGGLTWQASALPGAMAPIASGLAVEGDGLVLVSGTDSTATLAAAWLSRDAGKTWETLPLLSAARASAAALARGQLLVGTDRGLQMSADGKNWKWRNGPADGPLARSLTRGLRSFVIDHSARSTSAEGDLYIHDGEALLRSVDGAATWSRLPFPGLAYAGVALHVTAGGALLCGSYRSVDHGATWVEMQFIGNGGVQRFAGEGPVLYAVATGVWRSDDDGLSWMPLATGSPGSFAGENLVVNREGVVFFQNLRSIDKGMSWQQIEPKFSHVDHRDRLYELRREWLSVSQDSGMTSQPLTNGSVPAGYPSLIDAVGVGPDDRLWAHVDARPYSSSQGLVGGDQVHTTTVPAAPSPGMPAMVPVWTRSDEGLDQAAVTQFSVDRAGRMHAATNGGLYRYVVP